MPGTGQESRLQAPGSAAIPPPRDDTDAERWQSGRMRRSRKPLSVCADPGFESLSLRHTPLITPIRNRRLGFAGRQSCPHGFASDVAADTDGAVARMPDAGRPPVPDPALLRVADRGGTGATGFRRRSAAPVSGCRPCNRPRPARCPERGARWPAGCGGVSPTSRRSFRRAAALWPAHHRWEFGHDRTARHRDLSGRSVLRGPGGQAVGMPGDSHRTG